MKIILLIPMALLFACAQEPKNKEDSSERTCDTHIVNMLEAQAEKRNRILSDSLEEARIEIARLKLQLEKINKKYDNLDHAAEELVIDMCSTLEDRLGYEATIELYSTCEH